MEKPKPTSWQGGLQGSDREAEDLQRQAETAGFTVINQRTRELIRKIEAKQSAAPGLDQAYISGSRGCEERKRENVSGRASTRFPRPARSIAH